MKSSTDDKEARQALTNVVTWKINNDLLPKLVRLQRRDLDYKKKSKFHKQERVSDQIKEYTRAIGGEKAEKAISKCLSEVWHLVFDHDRRLSDLRDKIRNTLWEYGDGPTLTKRKIKKPASKHKNKSKRKTKSHVPEGEGV